jgi:uncharacterized repeat protein (TIGR01451 family)
LKIGQQKVLNFLKTSSLGFKPLGVVFCSLLMFALFLLTHAPAFSQSKVTNTAFISVPAGVTNTGLNCASGTCTAVDSDAVTPSRPIVSKSFTPSIVNAGGTTLLVITFTNTQAVTSATFTSAFTDAYPSGINNSAAPFAFSTCSNSPVLTATPGANTIVVGAGAVIAPGASCSVSVVVTGLASATNTIPPGALTTSAGSNTATVTAAVTVNPIADLALLKTVSSSAVAAGAQVTFTLVITNAGPSPANGASFTDNLPAGLVKPVLVSGQGATATVADNNVNGIVANLPGGGRVTLTFTATTNSSVSGLITNTAGVTPPVGVIDPTLGNNTATATVTALAPNANVSGRAWLDVNSDRIYNSGTDQDLAGYRVELVNASGVLVGSATTSLTGSYRISGQIPSAVAGTYSLRFRNPSGEVIVTTPLNQAATTSSGNPSTGTTTSAVNGTRSIGGAIGNISLYAGDNTVEQNLPIDPSGVVYDSTSRLPVAGARVTLYGPNNLAVPAACLVQAVSTQTTDATGIYRFDLIGTNPPPAGCTPQIGSYELRVVPPVGYSSSAAVLGGVSAPGVAVGVVGNTFTLPNASGFEVQIQPSAAAPAVGVNGASTVGGLGTQYFLRIEFNPATSSGVIHNHIPLDKLASGALLVSKVGDKSVAEIGDSVKYTIKLRNTTAGNVLNVAVNDLLPAGFRYIAGTARLGMSLLPDPLPLGNVARSLTFVVGTVTGTVTAELTYFVRLGVGSQQGDAINRATAYFDGLGGARIPSNTAQFRVRVQGGVFSNEGCMIGKVYVDCDSNSAQNNESGSRELGIPGVRLLMLNGTQITTDNEGKYSICGVKAQTHVIKLDRTTLPKGSRLMPSSNRNAGVGDSIFVDLKGGELARADFIEGSCSPEVLDQVKARRAQGDVLTPEKEIAPDFKMDHRPLQFEQQILPSLRPNVQSPAPGNAPGKAP